jgi:hypothetical protein
MGYVRGMNAYKISVAEVIRRMSLERDRRIWEDIIKLVSVCLKGKSNSQSKTISVTGRRGS